MNATNTTETPTIKDTTTEGTATAISRYPIPDINSLPDDIVQRILDVQKKAKFIPNVFLVLAHRPNQFRAFFDYYDAIITQPSHGLTSAEKEMIIVATSARNGCQYCVIAHGALLRVYSKQPLLADQIAINYLHAPISSRQKAMLAFALKLSRTPELIEESDYTTLKAVDIDDEDILDITSIVGLFGLSNRLAIVTNMQANTEFYTMGR